MASTSHQLRIGEEFSDTIAEIDANEHSSTLPGDYGSGADDDLSYPDSVTHPPESVKIPSNRITKSDLASLAADYSISDLASGFYRKRGFVAKCEPHMIRNSVSAYIGENDSFLKHLEKSSEDVKDRAENWLHVMLGKRRDLIRFPELPKGPSLNVTSNASHQVLPMKRCFEEICQYVGSLSDISDNMCEYLGFPSQFIVEDYGPDGDKVEDGVFQRKSINIIVAPHMMIPEQHSFENSKGQLGWHCPITESCQSLIDSVVTKELGRISDESNGYLASEIGDAWNRRLMKAVQEIGRQISHGTLPAWSAEPGESHTPFHNDTTGGVSFEVVSSKHGPIQVNTSWLKLPPDLAKSIENISVAKPDEGYDAESDISMTPEL
ncbi:uncharacterized protein I206_100773 [Kwoniella pini CBS 10737]|uniref:Uncharacterized protein n=1 Tax=Kwoniella pini CBS 10737 TaxID=1296096 RepID=A0AAJ8KZY0_9TREE